MAKFSICACVHTSVFLWIIDHLVYRFSKNGSTCRLERNNDPASQLHRNHSLLYQGGGGGGGGSIDNDNERSSSCSSALQKTWKLIVSIVRYDNETHRLLRLALPFTCSVICQIPFFFLCLWGRFMEDIAPLFGFEESATDIACK